jgi:hypothetical protein
MKRLYFWRNWKKLIPNIYQIRRKNELKAELIKILDNEELYWYKRCHENWLLKGDNNTEFFHRVANGRKRKQSIFSLQNDGSRIVGNENLIRHVTEYYKTLFGPGDGNLIDMDQNLWGEDDKVREQENIELIRPFSEEEIKSALFKMEKNKAAGPDGFPIEFFQKKWDVVKGDMLVLFDDFHKGELDIKRLNYGTITLLPKVKEATKIQQFKPICLLNCIYKWFTKTLTIRLEPIAGRIIHRNQAAFLGGRNIMSNILASHEILHETKRRGEIGVVVKLNFEKT